MGIRSRIAPEIREQILNRIKTDGVNASQAAREHGISAKTVYGWLSREAVQPSAILEINRVKRENEELKRLLGQAMLIAERSKKNQPRHAV